MCTSVTLQEHDGGTAVKFRKFTAVPQLFWQFTSLGRCKRCKLPKQSSKLYDYSAAAVLFMLAFALTKHTVLLPKTCVRVGTILHHNAVGFLLHSRVGVFFAPPAHFFKQSSTICLHGCTGFCRWLCPGCVPSATRWVRATPFALLGCAPPWPMPKTWASGSGLPPTASTTSHLVHLYCQPHTLKCCHMLSVLS